MKRRQFLKAAGVGLAASTAVAAPAIAQSMPTIKWRMPYKLAEVARYHLRRRRHHVQRRSARPPTTSSKIQPSPAARSCRASQIVDAVQNGTVEIGHTASYYYFGKDPTFGFGTSVPFGPNARMNQGWLMHGGGKEVLNEFYKGYNAHRAAGRQHWLPDGRLVSQGNQVGRRPQGPEDADRRLRRAACCKSSAVCRSRSPAATSIRRWRKAPSTPRVGRPLRRREARLLQGRAALLLAGLVGGRLDAVRLRQPRQVERAAEALSGGARAGRPLSPTPG